MTNNPQPGLDRGSLLPPTAEKSCLIVQTVLAVTIVVVAIKLGKLAAAFYMDNPRTALGVIYASWLVRIVGAVGGALVVGQKFWPRWKWRIAATLFLLFIPIKLLQALLTRTPEVAYIWLLGAAKQFRLVFPVVVYVLRRDLIFLTSFAILVYLAVTFTPAKYLRLLRGLLIASVCLMFAVSGIELASYCKMGVAGTGHLLAFFLSNATSLWPMLRSEMDATTIPALIMPFAVGLAVISLVGRWYRQPERSSVQRVGRAWPVVFALLIAAEFVPTPVVDHEFDRFVDNTYLGLRDLLPWRGAGQLAAIKQAESLPALFDTSKAVLQARKDKAPTPKNVIIIMLESARADSTSIYSPKWGNTPFLAEFAKRGAVVPEMYAVVPRTSAAWVATLAGVFPSTDEEMAPWAEKGHVGLRNLPMLLATRGYASAYFTTAHLNFNYDDSLIKDMHFDSVQDGDTLPNQGFEPPMFWGYEDGMMLAPSLNWVKEQRDKQNPFLLVMMTTVGHYDYKYPSKWQPRSFGTSDESYNSYLNCLGYVDSVMKEFVDGLDKLGVLRSSIVVILGDHGESFGEHGPRIHSLELYEETVKIPTILYAEDSIPAGTSISGLRQEVDILPTVLDLLGLSAENAVLPGTSLLRPVPVDRTIYFSGALSSQSTAVRRGGLKFIYNFGRTPTEVYEIDRDPGERHDIAATVPHTAIEKAEMDMMVWRERVSRWFVSPPGSSRTVH